MDVSGQGDALAREPVEATTIYSLLKSHSVERPDEIALAAPDRPGLTYGELVDQVEIVTANLTAAGVTQGDRVAIILPNGPELALAFLAVAAHAASAPLNPAYRGKEFEFYLDDLRPKAVMVLSGSDSPVIGVARARGIRVIELAAAEGSAAGIFRVSGDTGRTVGKVPTSPAENDALILHTSGTTSRPKMVALTQNNIMTSAMNVARCLDLGPADRCLNIMPLFHVHGLIAGVLAPLVSGGSVVCTPGLKPETFLSWLKELTPSWYTAVPTMHQTIVETMRHSPERLAHHGLRFIRSSSSALAPQLMTALEGSFGCPVIEAYGMTEAAHQITSNPLPPKSRKQRSVGLAAGPEVGIVDEAGTLLDADAVGEIAIRGANVTRGYVGNPAANAEAFTHGWFRTGDQGYLDADGYVFITGRLKEMINRGGENVAPREIDEAILENPGVRQAVAFAVPHPTLGEDIAVAVTLTEGSAATAEMIREFAFKNLADYKVPSQVILVDSIPKGPTGKVQRVGLADRLAPYLRHDYAPPRNDLEATVSEIFCQVLELDRVGVHDNFFALGGDSLRATRVISRIRAAFQVNLPIVSVFRRPSVEQLAAEIDETVPDVDQELLEELLTELDGLSDEEARALLDTELNRG